MIMITAAAVGSVVVCSCLMELVRGDILGRPRGSVSTMIWKMLHSIVIYGEGKSKMSPTNP